MFPRFCAILYFFMIVVQLFSVSIEAAQNDRSKLCTCPEPSCTCKEENQRIHCSCSTNSQKCKCGNPTATCKNGCETVCLAQCGGKCNKICNKVCFMTCDKVPPFDEEPTLTGKQDSFTMNRLPLASSHSETYVSNYANPSQLSSIPRKQLAMLLEMLSDRRAIDYLPEPQANPNPQMYEPVEQTFPVQILKIPSFSWEGIPAKMPKSYTRSISRVADPTQFVDTPYIPKGDRVRDMPLTIIQIPAEGNEINDLKAVPFAVQEVKTSRRQKIGSCSDIKDDAGGCEKEHTSCKTLPRIKCYCSSRYSPCKNGNRCCLK